MASNKSDIKPDLKAAEDRGERIALMEPLVLGEGSRHRAELTDLALELAQASGVPLFATQAAHTVPDGRCRHAMTFFGNVWHTTKIKNSSHAEERTCHGSNFACHDKSLRHPELVEG